MQHQNAAKFFESQIRGPTPSRISHGVGWWAIVVYRSLFPRRWVRFLNWDINCSSNTRTGLPFSRDLCHWSKVHHINGTWYCFYGNRPLRSGIQGLTLVNAYVYIYVCSITIFRGTRTRGARRYKNDKSGSWRHSKLIAGLQLTMALAPSTRRQEPQTIFNIDP